MTKKTGRASVTPKSTSGRKKGRDADPILDLDDEGFNADGIQIITPLSPDYEPSSGRKGRPDTVSPVMTPMLKDFLGQGLYEFQMEDGKPYTVYQIRTWANKLMKSGALPDEIKRVVVGGGKGSNISIRVTLND